MALQTITSFEVLAAPVAPGLKNVPYVQQGTFLQVTNLGSASSLVSLQYAASPAFVAASGAAKLSPTSSTNPARRSNTPLPTSSAAPSASRRWIFLPAPPG
jgi:hypothetical protein